jgi:hypothetical protein
MHSITIKSDTHAIVWFLDYEFSVICMALKEYGQPYCEEICTGANVLNISSISKLVEVLAEFKHNDSDITKIAKSLKSQLLAVIVLLREEMETKIPKNIRDEIAGMTQLQATYAKGLPKN